MPFPTFRGGIVLFALNGCRHLCRMTLLEHWQASGLSFAEGVRLLIQHGGARHLTKQAFDRLKSLAIFDDAPDSYNLGKLEYALRLTPYTATDNPAIEVTTSTHPSQPVVRTITYQADPLPSIPPHIKSLHKERDHYHARMSAATQRPDRAASAERVLDLTRQLDAAYDRLRNPEEASGQTNTQQYAEPTAADLRQLASLRTRASRLKNKLIPAATGARKAQLEKELTLKQADIKRLEEKIA